ncbi:hypothetical protein [Pantoea stewartii]|uniref:hypothetical protein n=1 Tax=Pantoea stewartii TaxID=66269 RepID=UPI003704452D
MKLNMPDKRQSVFILVVMGLVAYYAGSVIVYLFNHYSIKFIFKKYDSGVLWKILSQASFGSELWQSGFFALLTGLAAAMIVPVLVIYSMSNHKPALYGDAKFASDKDIEKSPQVVLYHPDDEKRMKVKVNHCWKKSML